jgi:hypothetical protein
MKQEVLHHLLLDASGSMSNCLGATLASINEQITDLKMIQKEHEDQRVSMALTDFSHDTNCWFDFTPAESLRPVTREQYTLRGRTALWDALGKVITDILLSHGEDACQNGATISIMVLTDGYENASVYFTAETIKLLITQLKEKGWEFRFVGADFDPQDMALKVGLDHRSAARFRKKNLAGLSGYMAGEISHAIRMKKGLT